MNKHLQEYFDSFKLKSSFWYTWIVDVLFWGMGLGLLSLFGKIIESKVYALTQGKTTEQLREMLVGMGAEKMGEFFMQMKSFLVFFVLGAVILIILLWLGFSWSRALIWGRLAGKRITSKAYRKWNLLHLALLLPLFVYLTGFALIKIVLNLFVLVLIENQTLATAIGDLVSLVFLLGFLAFGFLAGYTFVEKYKVWESIGGAFGMIKTKWPGLWPRFLFSFGAAIILSLVLGLMGRVLNQPTALLLINGGVFLLFLAWMRGYVFRAVNV